jgi:hypothetical protein
LHQYQQLKKEYPNFGVRGAPKAHLSPPKSKERKTQRNELFCVNYLDSAVSGNRPIFFGWIRTSDIVECLKLSYTLFLKKIKENAMNRQNRTQLVLGALLILLGLWFMAAQQVPALRAWAQLQFQWPFYVIGAGALILVIGLLTGAANMAIPACIVAGIGGVLYYQNLSNDWESWSFMWTLIPGFVGVGTILAGLLGEDTRHNLGCGINLLVVSAVLFLIFAAFFQRLNMLGTYTPAALLILLGLYIIGRGLIRSRGSSGG